MQGYVALFADQEELLQRVCIWGELFQKLAVVSHAPPGSAENRQSIHCKVYDNRTLIRIDFLNCLMKTAEDLRVVPDNLVLLKDAVDSFVAEDNKDSKKWYGIAVLRFDSRCACLKQLHVILRMIMSLKQLTQMMHATWT